MKSSVLWLDCHLRSHWVRKVDCEATYLPFLPADTNGSASVFYQTPSSFLQNLADYLAGEDSPTFDLAVVGNNLSGGRFIAAKLVGFFPPEKIIVVWNDKPYLYETNLYRPMGIKHFSSRPDLPTLIEGLSRG